MIFFGFDIKSKGNKIKKKKVGWGDYRLQARLQQYVNQELPNLQAGLRKGRGTRDQIANFHGIIKKAKGFQKNICFFDDIKAFDCVDHHKMWKILQEMGIPDHLTCLLRNLHGGQEATVGRDMEQWTGS